jgi:thienamycin biosynthesis protein ThnN
MNDMPLCQPTEEHIQRIVRSHFNPQHGTPYWLDWAQHLGLDPIREVNTFADARRLLRFADKDDEAKFERASRCEPLENFIPKWVRESGRWIWVSETGGTTGLPKRGCWDATYWDQVMAFSDHFMDAYGVPRKANWMFIGPTGPHTTGRLVISFAERRGGFCFSIDLDPRIVKIFIREGQHDAADRYIKHIWDQVAAVVRYQRIEVLFCTSKLLELLPEYIDPSAFRSLKAVLHAGTTMTPDTQHLLRTEVFHGIPIIGIYGTSTTGISFQAPPESAEDDSVTYIPSSPYIILDPVDETGAPVPHGQEGDVMTWRLTEDSLIPGFTERDRAIRVKPYGPWGQLCPWDWIRDPYSPQFTVSGEVEGVY